MRDTFVYRELLTPEMLEEVREVVNSIKADRAVHPDTDILISGANFNSWVQWMDRLLTEDEYLRKVSEHHEEMIEEYEQRLEAIYDY